VTHSANMATCRLRLALNFRNGARAKGHLIEISDKMFGLYDLLGQPLTSMQMSILSVPSGGQGHRSRSNECIFFKNEKMFLFSDFIKQMLDAVELVTNK